MRDDLRWNVRLTLHSEALQFREPRFDYLAQHMQQKLVGFLNSRR